MKPLNLDYIKGINFGYLTPRGKYATEQAKESMKKMVEETEANTVILVVTAFQKSAYTEEVLYKGKPIPEDSEVKQMINLAKSLGLKVILKPMVNCIDGTWRAHINFFDIETPCEPKWSNWFKSYTEFILKYAKLAEETKCEMLIVGCQLVQTERREHEWRAVVQDIRKVYSGLLTYCADKYQEGQVKWWDDLDVISSSGLYPINTWDEQLARIYEVVEKYEKPFFFSEAGCMSCEGSSLIPNDWTLGGRLDLEEQVRYYQVMFEKCYNQPWVRGFGLWEWNAELYRKELGKKDTLYSLYGKPACEIVKAFYSQEIK